MSSVPPAVPSHTPSIVSRTTASSPATAAVFAAPNGSIARSGSSLAWVQVNSSFSDIASPLPRPLDDYRQGAVVQLLLGDDPMSHHPRERREVLLSGGIAYDEFDGGAHLEGLHVPAELHGYVVAAHGAEVAHSSAALLVFRHEIQHSRWPRQRCPREELDQTSDTWFGFGIGCGCGRTVLTHPDEQLSFVWSANRLQTARVPRGDRRRHRTTWRLF